ncbi:MAG: alpha-ribazole phosphatase [Anaerophaga sp.]|nr:alpha-ribazole phosphatase [Anaerophaga sp.]MDI3521002.1 alpha-ribazole phosphatase [Anaerophaga sp.]MDK2842349.1 alpha-ribazole phosphatase [Anaerophaga sp.]MDN5291652.1 alpha-ribazole phosphatase [Anaerophaga sp.]
MRKNIYFIRHPKTEAPPGVCYGNSDVKPASRSLETVAAKARGKLNGVDVDIFYSSPLSRCTMLAEALGQDGRVVTSERLREINFGRWEMIPWADIPETEQKEWGEDFINCKIHGGENFYDVQKRVLAFLDELVNTSHSNIVVVTHAGLLRALLAHLLDASPRKIFAMHIDYGDVICLEWHNSEFYKVKYL